MAYCTNCGNQLREGAKFCDNCGFQVGTHDDDTKRQTVFEGKIHKCPNCGEIVEAFQDDCPACGFQFRNAQATSSVKELADKLEEIANEPNPPKRTTLFTYSDAYVNISDKASRQVSLIRNYSIPNTYEDIWEFLILASSNIHEREYGTAQTKDEEALSNAWKSKFEQAYQKAKLVVDSPEKIAEIEKLYSMKCLEIINAKRNYHQTFMQQAITPLIIIFVLLIILLSAVYRNYSATRENIILPTSVSYTRIYNTNFSEHDYTIGNQTEI